MRTIFILFLCSLIIGCAKEKSPSIFMVGMTPNEVIQIAGVPDEQSKQEEYTLFVYHDRQQPEASQQITDRWFIFKNIQLLEYSTQYLNPSSTKKTQLRLTASKILSQWIDSQKLTTNPSASKN
ncbi:Uncharacterised protein [Providencia rustigianii]|uniref:Lipoprotein SmpA/OmlA domain-containing protein n=2 Tax=Morganellaceae TaxID=1903414 RepID=A0A379G4Y9_9GAMM|nr:hypothetical protein [Providencia rustigianii]MTC57922.1 hypothetical protein [Providencia rustigianii]SPY78048.1 Uncharacterised protein [Providencia rustigianii]SUC36070.1 Uncharacterised protein [Providencia rustigianii]